MWPFKSKPVLTTDNNPIDIIDGTRNMLVKMRDFHRDGMLRWEKKITEAHLKHDQHETAYLAVEAVLNKMDGSDIADSLASELDETVAQPLSIGSDALRKMLDANSTPSPNEPSAIPYLSTPEQRSAEGWRIGDIVKMQGISFIIEDIREPAPVPTIGKRKAVS